MSLIPKKGTVYVVDDDEAVRDSLQWMLEGKDYRVRCFDSAESFLNRYDPREVACLIIDIRMSGMTGLELQSRLIETHSPLPLAFITGHGGPCSEGPSPLGLLKRPSSPKRAEARARSRRSPVRRGFLASAIRAASRCFTSSMSTYVAEGARA